jgi:hypothetical protein
MWGLAEFHIQILSRISVLTGLLLDRGHFGPLINILHGLGSVKFCIFGLQLLLRNLADLL